MRSAAGKAESGKISVHLRQESNEIALILSDDGAGLDIEKLHKKAVERGLSTQPWVKTSLAPGSQVVTEYLKESGLLPYLEQRPPTGTEIAAEAGVSRQYVWRVLAGRERPSQRVLAAMERLGVPVLEILAGERAPA